MTILDLDRIQEISEGLLTKEQLSDSLQRGASVLLKGQRRVVAIGEGLLVKVNVNIGCSKLKAYDAELKKIDHFSQLGYRPDTMMDLSIVRAERPLYNVIAEVLGSPVGTLPHYLCYDTRRGIDRVQLLEEIEKQASAGVSWMTLHLTVTRELYERAQSTRMTPTTARGGGIVVRDMYLNNRTEGILSLYFPDILSILKKYNVTLSIGSVFRPANVVEALDEVHRAEIEMQGIYIREARRRGLQVIMEGVGHMTMNKIPEYIHLTKERYGIPFVPLGPITTDAAVGEDHITNAIGASYMALLGGADLLNSVTREEHTGKVPTLDSVEEGLRAARIAAHSVNIARFPAYDSVDNSTAMKRGVSYTCVVEGGLFTESAKMRFSMGCSRCGKECPLIINYIVEMHK
jgi:phosphomethylpyrimidine synthase